MSKKTAYVVWTVTSILLAGTVPARGTVLTIKFSGVIDFVEDGLPFSDTISEGALFTGTYSYDTNAPDNFPNNSSVGAYSFPDYSISCEIGELRFETTGVGVVVSNYSILDAYDACNSSIFVSNGVEWNTMGIFLTDATATAFSNDSLPGYAPDLGDFAFERVFMLGRTNQVEASITGQVTSLTPEPGAFALLVLGLLCTSRLPRRVQ